MAIIVHKNIIGTIGNSFLLLGGGCCNTLITNKDSNDKSKHFESNNIFTISADYSGCAHPYAKDN